MEINKYQREKILSCYGVDSLQKAKSVPVGTINKYGERKMEDGTWKWVGKEKPVLVQDIVRNAIQNSVKQGYYTQDEVKNITPKEINNGLCDFVAEEAVKRIPGAKYMSTDDMSYETLKQYKFTTHGHAWFILNGKHYDAEAINGVDSWEDLPIFQGSRVRKTYTTKRL